MGTLSVSTEWGVISIAFTEKGLTCMDLPGDTSLNMADGEKLDITDDRGKCKIIASLLKDYFSGRKVDFSKLEIDLSSYSPFFRDVCRAARTIPYGEIRTYGQLAEMIGRKGAARAVGRVMAANPLPIIIPCHRVVSASGALTGYSAAGGIKTKERLLLMEGVTLV